MSGRTRTALWAMLGLVCVAASPAGAAEGAGKGAEGTWLGTLEVPMMKLRVAFKLVKGDAAALAGTMDSIDQGAKGIPVSKVTVSQRKVRIEVKAVGGVFEGTLSEDASVIKGQWTQAKASLPLVLKRVAVLPRLRRPQEPKRPYPYKEEQVTYRNEKADIQLAGTLTSPRGDGPFPAVLLITGSGPQDRNETLMGHRPFLVLADYLTRRGIAVLRVDDRGVGGSTGNVMRSTDDDFADDVLAGVAFLKGRKDIDGKRIGLIGHSEGGLVAPMAAARSPDVAFIVLMAGVGVPMERILETQGAMILKGLGVSDNVIAVRQAVLPKALHILRTEKDDPIAEKKIRKLAKEGEAMLTEADRKLLKPLRAQEEAQIKMMLTPWFRALVTYQPAAILKKVKCPVLAINGEKDLQVEPKENLGAIAAALKSGGNTRCTVRELPGLNHLFQTAKTGMPTEYGQIEETISPAAMKVIGDWLVRQTRPR